VIGIVSPCGNQSAESIKYALGIESGFRKIHLENATKVLNEQTNGLHDPEPCHVVRLRWNATDAADCPYPIGKYRGNDEPASQRVYKNPQ
jgi:hypothetical protein